MKRILFLSFLSTMLFSFQPAHSSWPGWGDDFKGQVVSNGKAIPGASIGAEFGCCTEAGIDGIFTIGLREGRARIYILPVGDDQTPSAGTFFTVTWIGKTATSVTNEIGSEVPIVDGIRQFELASPNISGEITTTSFYEGLTRYAYLSSPRGQTDIMMNRGRIQNTFAYKVSNSGEYVPYFEFRGSKQLFAIGPVCYFPGSTVSCSTFEIKEPNIVFRIVGASGNPASRTSVNVRPVLQGASLNGLMGWQNEDLSFSYYLADGIYLVEPFLNDMNNERRYWEVSVLNGKVLKAVDLFSNQEIRPKDGIYDFDYLTAKTRMIFSINLIEDIPGGAVFKLEPAPKIRSWISAIILDRNSNESLVSLDPPSDDGLITINGLKRQDRFQLVVRNSEGERLTISTLHTIDKPSEAEAKADAEAKAKADAEAKAKADAKRTTIICLKGKLTKKITSINPKCPKGYKMK